MNFYLKKLDLKNMLEIDRLANVASVAKAKGPAPLGAPS